MHISIVSYENEQVYSNLPDVFWCVFSSTFFISIFF